MNRKVITAAVAVAIGAVAAVVTGYGAWVLAVGIGLVLGWGLTTPRRLTYTLFACAFLFPVTIDPGLPTYPQWMMIAVLAAIAAYGLWLRRTWNTALAVLAALLPTAIVLSSLAHWHGLSPLVAACAPLLCYGVMTWYAIQEARRDPDGIRSLARVFAWIGVPLALLAVYQRATGTWPLLDQFAIDSGYTAVAGAGRSAALMGHPIIYGSFCMGMACVALVLRGRYWYIPFAANLLGLVLSGSRSAWVGLVLALVLWYAAQPRKITRRGVAWSGGLLAAVGLLWAFGPGPVQDTIALVRGRLTNLTASESANARYERSGAAWAGIWDDVWTFVFGHGPEGHVRFFRSVGIPDGLAQTFDNSYLTLWYDFGALVLLSFLALLVALLLNFRSLAARLILVGFIAQIWFFDFFLWPCAAALLVLGAALAVADRPGWQPSVFGWYPGGRVADDIEVPTRYVGRVAVFPSGPR